MKLTLILETDWEDEGNGETIAEVLRVLDSQKAWPGQGTEQVTWAAPLPNVEKLDPFSVTCMQSIINTSEIPSRTNVLSSRCGI